MSGATDSSGLCMRSRSWCRRSALAVRMGAAESAEYAGIRLTRHTSGSDDYSDKNNSDGTFKDAAYKCNYPVMELGLSSSEFL